MRQTKTIPLPKSTIELTILQCSDFAHFMTADEIVKMPAGPELDRMVHSQALGKPGRALKYSTDPAAAITLVVQLPIGVARVQQNSPAYNPEKPFVAFVLERHTQLLTFFTPTTIVCATLPLALSKMALLFAIAPKERAPMPTTTVPKIGTMIARPPLEQIPERPTGPKLPDLPPPPGVNQ